jgi:menaquinone-dependent protoporphyrinogen oxidase
MKILIAYRTRYGFTRRCVEMIQERLHGRTEALDLKERSKPELGRFDVVLIGGSVYGGKIQREIPRFCERYRDQLLKPRIGLFLSCLLEGDQAEDQLVSSFPPWLLARAFGRFCLGGELVVERLRWADRLLIRGIVGRVADRQTVRKAALERLVEAVNALED